MTMKVRTVLSSGLLAAAVVAGLALPGTAQASADSSYSDCPSGNVCFYTGDDGTGKMCAWSVDDPDWRSGSITCSWSATTRAQSVYNHGVTGAPVSYYTGANYGGSRAGCTKAGTKGNFVGNSGAGYFLRSHKWEC
ncbi:peptidase inhibitor family I36 protein [Streptomyces griseofuscus]|uniref:peptidase inhibitor family I36 protein n=1 Tax=Streptomyces griseofuscus TaxID=146922 RepID=UPI0037FE267A